MNAIPKIPPPVNEPVLSYAPSTPERVDIKKALKDLIDDLKDSIGESARKELQKLHPSIAHRILQRIEALATSPRPSALLDFRVTRIFGEFELETIELFIASMTPLGISTFL